jgi:hypothetical protein
VACIVQVFNIFGTGIFFEVIVHGIAFLTSFSESAVGA